MSGILNFASSEPLTQGCQLSRIAWREIPKHEQKIVILLLFPVVFASASVKLCISFNFKKK